MGSMQGSLIFFFFFFFFFKKMWFSTQIAPFLENCGVHTWDQMKPLSEDLVGDIGLVVHLLLSQWASVCVLSCGIVVARGFRLRGTWAGLSQMKWLLGDQRGKATLYQGYTTLCQISNIRCTLGNEIVDHSDVVGASPVGAAPTASSFST